MCCSLSSTETLVSWGGTRGGVMYWFSYSTETLVIWGGARGGGGHVLVLLLYRNTGDLGWGQRGGG